MAYRTIDFDDPGSAGTYVGRVVQPDWAAFILGLLDPEGLDVADIGCGGGLYAAAWADLGAGSVTAVDSSPVMVADARRTLEDRDGARVVAGRAEATGLPTGSADVVHMRALIHHLADLAPAFDEARRLLRPGGWLIVQDRTPQDVALPGAPDHLRGHLLDAAPRLREIDLARRPESPAVLSAIAAAGLVEARRRVLWETRRVHASPEALGADLRARTGRSILHALSDDELEAAVLHVLARIPSQGELAERDRWTVWTARAPS